MPRLSRFSQALSNVPRQPRINWNSPQAQGLRALVHHSACFGTGLRDMVRGNTGTITGADLVNAIQGPGYDYETGDTSDRIQYCSCDSWTNPTPSYISCFVWLQAESNVPNDASLDVLSTAFSAPFSDTFYIRQAHPDGLSERWTAHVNTVAGAPVVNGTTVPIINKPQHIGFTYNGTLRLYVNGVEEANVSDSSTMEYWTDNPDIIEGNNFSASSGWDGIIYEWRIYNYALSSAQVWQLYDPLTRWDVYDREQTKMSKGLIGATPARIHDFMPFFMNLRPGSN